MAKVKFVGTGIYRGADEHRSASLTVVSGDEVEVSDEKAKELLASKDWQACGKIAPTSGPAGETEQPAPAGKK